MKKHWGKLSAFPSVFYLQKPCGSGAKVYGKYIRQV
jgi:hypothetical protein